MSTADQKACLRGPGVRCQSARSQPLVEPSIELAILDRDDEPGSDASIRIVGLHSPRSDFAGYFDYDLEDDIVDVLRGNGIDLEPGGERQN